jgi:hypothetical protein
MKNYFLLLLLTSGMLVSPKVSSQGWHWEWAKSVTAMNSSLWQITATATDTLNNLYCQIPYQGAIYFPDTSFQHQGNQYSQNVAVAIYSEQGKFQKALDIYTPPENFIWSPSMATDRNSNIYATGSFQNKVFIRDSVINHGVGFDPFIPDQYLARISPELNVLWTRLIWGSSQVFPYGMVNDREGNLYLATGHYGNGAEEMTAYFLGQDSAKYMTTLNCIIKVDPAGNLLWRKEIRSFSPGTNSDAIFKGNDNQIFLRGRTNRDIIVDGDTIHVPDPTGMTPYHYLIESDKEGKILSGRLMDWNMYLTDMKAGSDGYFYLAGSFNDTLHFGGETIPLSGDSVGYILAKLRSDLTPAWYHVVKTLDYATTMNFSLIPEGDSLFFTTSCNRTFTLAGVPFNIGYYSEALSGSFSPEGILGRTFITTCNMDLNATSLLLDNCKNLLITGYFWTKAVFGSDSLNTVNLYRDVFLSKFQNQPPPAFDLGPDTSICNGMVLHGPPGYAHYIWNEGESYESSFPVVQSGKYRLDVADEDYCWMTDSVIVSVTIMPPPDLGNDTTIFRKDTLFLNAGPGYEKYRWSTGDTTYAITLQGSDFDAGSHVISVEVTDGPCTGKDSVTVTILNNPGLWEPGTRQIRVYPNPSDGLFFVEISDLDFVMTLTNPAGLTLPESLLSLTGKGNIRIDLTNHPRGVYFLRVSSSQGVRIVKLVKL